MGNPDNNLVPVAPEQAAPAGELATAFQEAQANVQGAQGGFLDAHEPQKTAIVGSWQGTAGDGSRILASFTSDGIALGSVQAEVSLMPDLPVLTRSHGVWTHIGGRQFLVTAVIILYDIRTGEYQGFVKIRVLLRPNETGDQMNGTDKVEFFGPDGNLVDTFPSGTVHYTRIKVEPFD